MNSHSPFLLFPSTKDLWVHPLCHCAPAENETHICDPAVTYSEIDF